MLDGNRHTVFICAALVRKAHFQHLFRVVSIGTHVHDGISPVEVQVAHGRKGKIAARRGRLPAGNIAKAVGVLGIVRCACGHLLAKHRAVLEVAGGAKFEVGGAQQRHAAVFLHKFKRAAHLRRRAGFKQQAAHAILQQLVAQVVFVRRIRDRAKQLPQLFVLRQGGKRSFHPRYLFFVKKERIGLQVGLHCAFSFCFLRNLFSIANSLFR